MSQFEIKPAARSAVKPLGWRADVAAFKESMKPVASSLSSARICFGFFGSVGGGKSTTAGIFAIGITPQGLIGWIDGEGGRSGYAIDQVADMAVKKYGGTKQQWVDRFRVVHVGPPFNPLAVVAAIEVLEEAGCKTIIPDVLSQCWDSEGGYLDLKNEEIDRMAGDDDKKRERSASSAAAHVKPWTHGRLVSKINSSKCHMVLLFQAKQKYNAKTFRPDDFVSPIQESGLTRLALAVGRIEAKMVGEHPQGGFCTFSGAINEGTKFTHPSLWPLLPKNGEQFKFEHAEAIARWCAAPSASAPVGQPSGELSALKSELWSLTKSVHMGKKENVGLLQQWLIDEAYIDPDDQLDSLSSDRLRDVLARLKGAR